MQRIFEVKQFQYTLFSTIMLKLASVRAQLLGLPP